MPGWADYERGTLKTRLLGQGRVLYYPDVKARELLRSVTGVDLLDEVPLGVWESVVSALQKAQQAAPMERNIESLVRQIAALLREHE